MWKRVVSYAVAAVLGVLSAFLLSGVFIIEEVYGNGMEPALKNGSKVIINKLAFDGDGGENVEAGSLIAFRSDVYGEDGEGRILIRRVAAVPGDTVEIKNDIFYVNDKPYTEYMKEAVHLDPMVKIKLGDYKVFVLSDDRKSSMDSRNEAIGLVDIRECLGRVCFR